MTKKDYELIAGVLREAYRDPELHRLTVTDVAKDMAAALAADNARFDRSRFLAACQGLDSTDSAGRKVRYS
jgi:hypothetical protein